MGKILKQKDSSLRTRIFTLMSVLVAMQSFALIIALFVSQVFLALDAEAFRQFENTAVTRAEKFNESTDMLVGSTATATQKLADQLEEMADMDGKSVQELYLSDELYKKAAFASVDLITDFLRDNSVTGAFVIFKGSNAEKTQSNHHSMILLRNMVPEGPRGDSSAYQIELGPSVLSREYGIHIGPNWDIGMVFDDPTDPRYNFYNNPVKASQEYKKSEIERYGYWSPPFNVLKEDRDKAITYSMPMLDENGEAFGVFGLEISLPYITRRYLPDSDMPYNNSFFTIATMQNEHNIDLSWFIPSGPIAQVYLEQVDNLLLQPVRSYDFSKSQVPELGEMYTYISPLALYSDNSPFVQDEWTMLTLVSSTELHETSKHVRNILIGSITITTVIAFVAVFFLTYFSTRQISSLPEEVRKYDPYSEVSFGKTGLSEIDELTSAIEMLSRSVVNASKITSKIMELTSMPLGGFEIVQDNPYITVTDYVRQLMGRSRDESITKDEWNIFYKELTRKPMGNDDVYGFYSEQAGGEVWLRIQQASTAEGYVGTVLDVTEDIERTQQLAKELDHDSLTHLFNRTAFKREAYNLIHTNPDTVGAMIFADLDNLKFINDSFGHDAGDRFLIRAGEMFDQFSKKGGIVSRISGDEFAVYLHGHQSQEEIRDVISEVFSTHKNYYIVTADGEEQRVRFSAGIAWYPEDSDNITDLLKLSDYAMYEAKNKQKGATLEFNKESYQENVYLLENREAINQLIDGGLIQFVFQPIVSLQTGAVYGYEALMRPMLSNFQSPLEVLAVASAESKMAQLERMIILKAYQYVADHLAQIGDKKIFINSIPDQVLSQEDMEFISRRYAHIAENVVIEITEDKGMSLGRLQDKVSLIKKHASMIAIDDYGAGYSNEIRILSLEPDIIKIDMGIIQGVSKDVDKQKLVQNIISFCKTKDILTIAEGVETEEDLEMLIKMKADFVQGFLLGKPKYEMGLIDKEMMEYIWSVNRKKGFRYFY